MAPGEGTADSHSDWDLAVAFDPVKLSDPLNNRYRPELLALDWVKRALGLTEGNCQWWISIRPPIPLALPSWMPIGALCRSGVDA